MYVQCMCYTVLWDSGVLVFGVIGLWKFEEKAVRM